jgi:hypothetical protein
MDSVDIDQLRRRVRVAYEWGRLRRALLGLAPALLLGAVAAWIGGKPSGSAPFGLGLFVVGVTALWYGREPHRAVFPGIVAGLIPVVLILSTMRVGHLCFGARCTSVCIVACAAGGLGAGVVVGFLGARARRGAPFWITASALALLTGAIGCTCPGSAGLAGLAAEYGTGTLPALSVRSFRHRS